MTIGHSPFHKSGFVSWSNKNGQIQERGTACVRCFGGESSWDGLHMYWGKMANRISCVNCQGKRPYLRASCGSSRLERTWSWLVWEKRMQTDRGRWRRMWRPQEGNSHLFVLQNLVKKYEGSKIVAESYCFVIKRGKSAAITRGDFSSIVHAVVNEIFQWQQPNRWAYITTPCFHNRKLARSPGPLYVLA